MATSSSTTSKRIRNPTFFLTFSFFLLFLLLFGLFIFTRNGLPAKLSDYTNLISETTVIPVVYTNVGSVKEPILSNSGKDGEGNEDASDPVSSKSDLDDGNGGSTEKSDEPVSSKPDLDDNKEEGSSEERIEPVLLKSDLDGGTNEKSSDLGRENEDVDIIDNVVKEELRKCDLYKGTWVRDESYPLYEPGSCPYVDEAFDCQGNGRPDSEYLKWRWKPHGCELPRFNATDFLVRLRGKRLMLTGDSMNRNQFESLLCMLREGLSNKSKMYEVHGYKITKGRGYYIFKFEDYNCSVEFVRSHFLVREGIRVNGQGNSNPTLSVDRIDKAAARWKRADILVFNTGHWWVHGKTARGKNYYKEGNHVYPHLDAVEAYRRSMKTWAKWIKQNARDKLAMYRGYSSAHFRGGDWDSGGSCKGEKEPAFRGAILDSYPQKMMIVEEAIREMHVPVVLLNVTGLTNYRKDGHPSVYRKNVTAGVKVSMRKQDCSHWCLPGVPDAWNELIYTTLITRKT